MLKLRLAAIDNFLKGARMLGKIAQAERNKYSDVQRTLRAHGKRVTPQRALILKILQKRGGHLDADEIYRLARQERPRLSLSTVYRTLSVLKELGLVRELRFEEGYSRYELAGPEEHHHLICLGCGKVVEFQCAHCAQVHQDLADRHGFQITGSRVELLGYCAECQKRRKQRR